MLEEFMNFLYREILSSGLSSFFVVSGIISHDVVSFTCR